MKNYYFCMIFLYFSLLGVAVKANDKQFLPENVNYHTIYKKVLNKQKRAALKEEEREARLLLQKNEKAEYASKTFLEKIVFIWSRYIWGSMGRPELGVMVIDKESKIIAVHPSNALRFIVVDEKGITEPSLQD